MTNGEVKDAAPHLLVVDDDGRLRRLLQRYLSDAGYRVTPAQSAVEARSHMANMSFDLVVLDVMMPDETGFEFMEKLRRDSDIPVLMLTARGDAIDRIDGLERGVDDYLAKPFELGELVARVRALVRRAGGHTTAVMTIGRLTLDTRRMEIAVDGAPVRVSPLEYRLLDYLAHQQGRTVSAGELAEHLHGGDGAVEPNAIEALVARLRRKVGADLIETRRGFGYALAQA